jgi:hypothetical protein
MARTRRRRRPKPKPKPAATRRERATNFIRDTWRVIAAVVAVAAGLTVVAAYLWPRGPGKNDARLSARLTPYKTFGAYRSAAAPNCSDPTPAPNCTRYPAEVLASGPVLGLWPRVEKLVGYRGTTFTWRWELFDDENTPAPSQPPGGDAHEVVSDQNEDSLDLQPAPIFPSPAGGRFYVRVTLEDDPGHIVAHVCSPLVSISGAGKPYHGEAGAKAVDC